MQEKDYRKRIEEWIACGQSGLSPRESFMKLEKTKDILSYTDWLILPGEAEAAGMTEDVAKEWNDILYVVFSRTLKYRQKEAVLWERIQELAKWLALYTDQGGGGYRLLGSGVPKTDPEVVGREKETELLAKRLAKERIVFLYGIGGIGKSAVARSYALAYAGRYDTIVYASCEGDLRELFADDGRIPVCHMAYSPGGKRGELGWYVRRKLKVLREITDTRTLLVIDNFDRMRDPLLEKVFDLPCHILFTTRTDPAYFGKTGIKIRALTEKEDLLRLFALYYGELPEEEKETVPALLEKFQGHTLYVKLLAGYCRMEGMLPSKLLEKKIEVKEQIFRLSSLLPKEKQILKNASLLPVMGMEIEQFFRLSGNQAQDTVHTLIGRGLIEYDAGRGWISLHPVVRQETFEVLKPSWYSCRNFIRNFQRELSNFWGLPMEKKMGCLSYVLGILETLPLTDAHCMEQIFFLTDLLWQLGQWSFALHHTRALYEECRRVFGCPHPNTARAAHLAASVYHNQREKKKAAVWYERAYLAYCGWPEKEPGAEGLYLMKYNRCFVLKGEYGRAGELLKEAEGVYLKEIKAKRNVRRMKSDLQNAYIEHTRLCIAQGAYEEALSWCGKADQLCEDLNGSKTTKAYIRHDEAVIRWHLGQPERAELCLEEAVEYATGYLPKNQSERLEIEKVWRQKEQGTWERV